MIIGTIIGGLLARPALQYPWLFCDTGQCNDGKSSRH